MNKEKTKTHFKENKKTYVVATSTALLTAITVFLITKRSVNIKIKNNGTIVGRDQITINHTDLRRRGNPQNVIRCLETNVLYPSQTEAARAMSINQAYLSRHLHGRLPNVNGYTFEKIATID